MLNTLIVIINTLIVTILFAPVWIKWLASLHKKVLLLKYTYFPFSLHNMELRYQYKKHIIVQLNIAHIHITKIPGQWRFKVNIQDLQIIFIPNQPIKIGFQFEEQLYMERLKSKFISYTQQKIAHRKNKQIPFLQLLLESTAINCLFLTLSRLDIHFNKMAITLPRLNSKDKDLPNMTTHLGLTIVKLHLNQNGHLQWTMDCEGANMHQCFIVDTIKLNAITKPGLLVDLLEEHSQVNVEIHNVIWYCRKEYFYTMDVMANEFWTRPDINKILKRHLNEKGFLFLGKPRDMNLNFHSFKIEFSLFDEADPDRKRQFTVLNEKFHKYTQNKLSFHWVDLQYQSSCDIIKHDQIKKGIIYCKQFTVATLQEDIKFIDIEWKIDSLVSNTIHANDDTKQIIKYGDLIINISPQLIKFFALLQTELASEFRVCFVENYEQSKYFKKYNRIAKQMCCDFFGVELSSKMNTFYDFQITNKFQINLIYDGIIINSVTIFNFHLLSNDGDVKNSQITFDDCYIDSAISKTEASLKNFKMISNMQENKYSFSTFNMSIEQKNIEKLLKVHQSQKIFRQQLSKFTSFKLTPLEKQKQKANKPIPKETILNCNQIDINYSSGTFCASIKVHNIDTKDPNNIDLHQFNFSFQNSELLLIDQISTKNTVELMQVNIKSAVLQLTEEMKDLSVFVQQIKDMQSIVSRKQIFDISQEDIDTSELQKRRASFDGVVTLQSSKQEHQTKVRSIFSKNTNLSINTLDLVVKDTKLNDALCRYRRFQEKFETTKSRQNESRVLECLKTQLSYPLLLMRFEKLSAKLKKIDLTPNQVVDKITKLDSHPTQLDQSFFDYFELLSCEVLLEQVKLSIRDYRLDLLDVRGIRFNTFVCFSRLNTQNIQIGLRVFYDFNFQIRQLQLSVGLNLVFAFREISNRLSQFLGETKNQAKDKIVVKEQLTFWDRFRLKFHGKLQFQLDHLISQVTTDILPYSIDCVKFQAKLINVEFLNWTLKAWADELEIGRVPEIQKVLFIPRIQMITEFNWYASKDQYDHYFYMRKPYFNQINTSLQDFISQQLQIEVKVDCIQYEHYQESNFRDQQKFCFFIHYQNQFMRWLKNRPILRHDVLRLFQVKITKPNPNNTENQPTQTELNMQNMYADYKTLVNYTYIKLMESLMIKQSLYKHTKKINIRVYSNKFRIFLTNSEKPVSHSETYLKGKDIPYIGIQGLMQSLKVNIQLEPNCINNEWRFEVQSIAGKCDQLVCAMFDGKSLLDVEQPETLTQQQQFVNFFDLQPIDYYTNEVNQTQNLQSMTFHELKKLKKFLKQPFIINTTITPQYHLFDLSVDQSSIEEEPILETRSRASHVQSKPNLKNDFNAFDIFLKAQQLEYKQNQEIELQDEEDENQKTKKVIQNFISASNSQFLFTFYLQEVWGNVFESLEIPQSKDAQLNDFEYQQVEQKPKCYCREELKMMVSLGSPQFNFQYHNANCQMILTSPKDCQIIISEYVLPFDNLEIDKKSVTKLIFNGLDCSVLSKHIDAKSQVRFLGNDYERIIRCNYALFQIQNYQMRENLRDFTEIMNTQKHNPHYWNQELRRPIVLAKVGQLDATMKKYQLDQFQDMLNFLEMAVTTKNEFENKERFYRNKMKELNQYGFKQIDSLVKKKILETSEKYGSEKSRFDYAVQETTLQLLDDFENSFILFNIRQIRIIETVFENESHKIDILLQDLDAVNQYETDPDYKMVLSQELKDSKQPFFRMIKKYYPLQIYLQKWFVIDQHDLKINPLTIKLTEEMYDQFYNYFFGDDTQARNNRQSIERKEQIKNSMESISKQVPDFFNSLQVSELKLNASYRSPSKLKRFKDVTVQLEPYKSPKQFSTTKEQFDEFATFVIKQMTTQIFSILGKKLFGN